MYLWQGLLQDTSVGPGLEYLSRVKTGTLNWLGLDRSHDLYLDFKNKYWIIFSSEPIGFNCAETFFDFPIFEHFNPFFDLLEFDLLSMPRLSLKPLLTLLTIMFFTIMFFFCYLSHTNFSYVLTAASLVHKCLCCS